MRIRQLKRRLARKGWSILYRGKARPVFVQGNTGGQEGLSLHIGAGNVNLQGWVNIDASHRSHIHLAKVNFGLENFGDQSVSRAYMCHVLEHLSDVEISELFVGLNRILAPGGTLLISVPDFSNLMAIYEASGDTSRIARTILGGQDNPYNFHKQIFDYTSLRALLESVGYAVLGEWQTRSEFGRSLGDWSDYYEYLPSGKFPISLNLKAEKVV